MAMVPEHFHEAGREEVDFHAPGGWDKSVEWQLKARDLLGPMLLESRHLEAQPLDGQDISISSLREETQQNGNSRSAKDCGLVIQISVTWKYFNPTMFCTSTKYSKL